MRKLVMAAAAVCALTALPDSDAEASIIGSFPDVIVCNFFGAPNDGPHIFYLIAQEANQSDRIFYRIPNSANDPQFLFNPDGSFFAKQNVNPSTDCDNLSLAQIEAAGQARFFAETGGCATIPAGAMTHFNLAACPGGWTQQVQLNPVSTADQPMVLCRKD